MGFLEIWITPSNGVSSSRIKKIAPDTDSAASISAIMTVAFAGANKPALMKMIASQETKTISIAVRLLMNVSHALSHSKGFAPDKLIWTRVPRSGIDQHRDYCALKSAIRSRLAR
jgi:hypothetical protein